MTPRRTSIALFVTTMLATLLFCSVAYATPSQADLDSARDKLTTLGDSMAQAQTTLSDTSDQLEITRGQIADTEAQIAAKQTELEAAQKTLSGQITSNYKTGGTSLLDVLLNSSSLDDLVSGIYYMDKVNSSYEDAIAQVKSIKEELTAKKSELTQQETDQQAALESAQQQYDSYQAQVDEAQTYYDQLDAEVQAALAAEAAAAATTDDIQTGLTNAVNAAGETQTDTNPYEGDTSDSGSSSSGGSSSDGSSVGSTGDIVSTALQFVGYPYVWGAKGPNAFDCSGFTSYVYSLCGQGWGYATAAGQADMISNKKYSVSELDPGDLIICNNYGHVGIYIGNNQMVHASTSSTGVIVSDLTWYVNNGRFQFGGSPN